MVRRGFEALGHTVRAFELDVRPVRFLKECQTDALTIVMQGYGLAPQLIAQGRRLTRHPWILWHAEVMSPTWPTDDPVVQAKARQLAENAYAFDAIAHNCYTALETVKQIRGERGAGKPVIWAPANGVEAHYHRRLLGVTKRYAMGFYGYASPRRVEIIEMLRREGIPITWRLPNEGCWGDGLIAFINQCHCILNLHFSQTPNTECRVYEALGCGVPVLSEPLSMPNLLPFEGRGIEIANSPAQLLQAAQKIVWLAERDPATLARYGNQVQSWLHTHASYTQRCQFLLDQIAKHFPLPA